MKPSQIAAEENSLSENNSLSLYDRDFCLWAEVAAQLLREGKFTELDLENLIEEVEDMSGSQKRAFASNLRVLLMHLLKCKYQPRRRSRSWELTIIEHRIRLDDALTESPSLQQYFLEVFDKTYQKARNQAVRETKLAIETFPPQCPFNPEQLLDGDFFP